MTELLFIVMEEHVTQCSIVDTEVFRAFNGVWKTMICSTYQDLATQKILLTRITGFGLFLVS